MPCLKDKVTVITGASSGLGEAAALHFADLGAKLMLSGRNGDNLNKVVEECKKRGAEASSLRGDVTDESYIKELVDKTIQVFGRIDVLVNNAGRIIAGGIEATSLESYDAIMNTNLRAVFHLTMLATPHLIESKGAIVNVSSLSGIRAQRGVLAYAMSKAAMDQFTACVALELASKQVRVNSVNPGVIPTHIHRDIGFTDEQFTQMLEQSKGVFPMGRLGEPLEVAKAIAFLASDEASYTTGATFPIDGGSHATCLR